MSDLTPMMRQYLEIKADYPDAILFFRLGDFYEMFLDDAVKASRILDITLTSRNRNSDGSDVPLCGVPYHSVSPYIAKLIEAGEKVAICEQVEDPKATKGIVRREVVKVITPGTVIAADLLKPGENNYLLSLVPGTSRFGLSYLDLSTGDFRVTELDTPESVLAESISLGCLELLLPESVRTTIETSSFRTLLGGKKISYCPEWVLDREYLGRLFARQFPGVTLAGLGCDLLQEGLSAAGLILYYLNETQKGAVPHIQTINPYVTNDFLVLDETTRRNLELTATMAEGKRHGSLLGLMDRTVTSMGARKLRHWISHPLVSVSAIGERQEAVAELLDLPALRRELREVMNGIYDLERLIARISLASAGGKDLVALKESLAKIPLLTSLLAPSSSPLLQKLCATLEPLSPLVQLIGQALVDTPPFVLREGGIIRDGYNAELDELRTISSEGKGYIARIEATERARTGISSLKVRYNRVFGYYIEITRANLGSVPESYQRRQTLANAERFITPELKEYEEKVLGAEERICDLEYRLFQDVREETTRHAAAVASNADIIATIDLLAGLSELAADRGYCRPELDESDVISITEGRHPVIEAMPLNERFVPNDVYLDSREQQIWMITGPNMAGKSTFMRQVALIVLMAQTGSFVPAAEARIGVVDRIFTRVGASDNLARGESTFMVEMRETASILRYATARSLVIMDEIGRGTSTFDGVSIAWAVAEYLHDNAGHAAKTLFATHYHELTELSVTRPRIKNYNIAVKEWNDQIIFLRTIIPGGASHSYGIQVARLAGLPADLIERSKEILANLEKGEFSDTGMPRLASGRRSQVKLPESPQMSLFSPEEDLLKRRLRGLNIAAMTPLEALNLLDELKRMC